MSDSDQSASALADRYWNGLLELEPFIGTQVGDERFDDRLPDPSEEGLAARETFHRGALRELESIDRSSASETMRTTLDVLEATSRREIAAIETRFDRLMAVTHLWGPGQLLAELASFQRADTPERLERYVARLRAVPQYLEALGPIMDGGVAAGQVAPGIVVDRAIAQVERLLATPIEESPATAPVGDDEMARERATEVVQDKIVPAYATYLERLKAYRPSASATIGLSSLPRGDAMYAAQVLGWTTLPLDPREVHETGRDQLTGIQEERREAATRLGFDDPGAAVAALEQLKTNFASTRQEIVDRAQDQVQRGWDAAPRMFGRMPKENCEVRPVEEYREADMPFAFYNPPTADNSRRGVYYVNTSDPEQRPLHQLATTTYHEANPGHHFQIAIEQEIPDRPDLRRFGGILGGSAFIEGWGLYSERLADELELFVDESERLGMLDMQAFRACRLIADTGIHAFGWDRERAIEQMQEAGVPRMESEVEVDRYIALPGQAQAYMIGQLEIQKWRADAERLRGASFDVRDFHDRLLGLGSLPLPALRREMGSAG